MVLLDSADDFFAELEQMFALCKERGAGTVYTTLKKVEQKNKKNSEKQTSNGDGGGRKPGAGGRREGWLARAKISNKKARKISLLVSDGEVAQCRERLQAVKKSMPVATIAGGTKKRGRRSAGGGAAGAAGAKQSSKRTKGGTASPSAT